MIGIVSIIFGPRLTLMSIEGYQHLPTNVTICITCIITAPHSEPSSLLDVKPSW